MSLFLAVALTLSIAVTGCSNSGEDTSSQPAQTEEVTNTEDSTTEEASEETAEEAAEEASAEESTEEN